MDYLQSILDLDSAALAQMERGPAAGASSVAFQARLASLMAEVENAATLVAVSGSIANALAGTGMPPVAVSGFATYAPPDLTGLHAWARDLIAVGGPGQLAVQMQEFGRRLGLARRMADAHVAEVRRGRGPVSVEAEPLADAWSRTCRSARDLVQALAALTGANASGPEADRLADLVTLLERVAKGEAVCVEADGCVVVPGFAERRRHARFDVDQAAEICFGANVYPIRLVDASVGGLGIEGPRLLLPGDAVTVRMADGRKLRAHVAWVREAKAGLRFVEPLQATDPLLAGGAGPGGASLAA